MYAYCLFCKTGYEKEVVDLLNRDYEDVHAFAPTKVLLEKRAGIWEKTEHLLIKSYIFVYAHDYTLFNKIKNWSAAYRLLQYDIGEYELQGDDFKYAEWIYKNEGRIEASKILFEDDNIKVLDGPLKDGIGTIKRIDKHKKRAWVEFDFNGKKRIISLSIVDVTPI